MTAVPPDREQTDTESSSRDDTSRSEHPVSAHEASPEEPGGRHNRFLALEVAGYLIAIIVTLSLASGLILDVLGYLPEPGATSGDATVSERGDPEDPLSGIPDVILMLVGVLVAPLLVWGTHLYGRRFAGVGLPGLGVLLPRDWRRWSVLAIAAALVAPLLWLVLAAFAGGVTVEGLSSDAAANPLGAIVKLLLWSLGFLVLGITWEVVFRGYLYTRLRRHISWPNAVGVSSVGMVLLFGDPSGPVYGLLNVFFLGLALALTREVTGSIVPGAIAHTVWNVTIACLLSLPLSGTDAFHLLAVETTDVVALTGGSFGPEGSLTMTAMLLPAVVALAFLVSDRQERNGEETEPESDL